MTKRKINPQIPQKDPNSEIGIWRHRKRLGISCMLSNSDVKIARSKWLYDPETGIIKFISGKKAGQDISRQANPCGYLTVSLYNTNQLAHRVAWLLHYGILPPKGEVIDHINGDQTDNRLVNLRACLHARNIQNHKINARNKSGVTGVHANNRRGGWDASIRSFGKDYKLGTFPTFEDAVKARISAEKEHHGEFSRISP
jgi:hypothetical protein